MVVNKKRGSMPTSISIASPSAPSAQMKYRPAVETGRWAAKGTIPLPEPATVVEVFTKVLVHTCKRVLYVDSRIRLIAYAFLLFFISLVADYMPFPRSYFSHSGNVLNQYFVKLSWAWTCGLVGTFIFMTSSVYCCGDRQHMKKHFVRLVIATGIWYVWTNLFRIIEESTGQCIYQSTTGPRDIIYSRSRKPCLKSGGKWTSIDISGHSFILIWCTMFIIEESKAILGWDSIQDYIRNEDYRRRRPSNASGGDLNSDKLKDTPLSSLSTTEFENLKTHYKKYGNLSKVLLICLTLLTMIWDLMILMTACYFHVMIEKVIGGLFAVAMWWITYRFLYISNSDFSPGLPGIGLFRYSPHQKFVARAAVTSNKIGLSPDDGPSFMGMPLYPLKKRPELNSGSGIGFSSN